MSSRKSVAQVGLWRRVLLGACAAAAVGGLLASPAEARSLRHFHGHRHVAHSTWAGPPFSAIVVDENSGRTLYSVNENEPRHPASITKVMTLYLLFEKLQSGALTLNSPIEISEHAAAQEPSKLGVAPGDSITVEEAIKAIVTRSANDVAVAVAENIGGSESAFADQMTRKAHELGMSRTTYRNASGLPNDEQITTAHDLSVLARATEEKFPQYFHYFSTHEFEYAGETIGNHNHLLGRVDGVDGIKTGYTRASGFNLMTSMHRDGRSIVAIVMGGRTAGSRDQIMEGLLAQHYAQASAGARTASVFAEADTAPTPAAAPKAEKPMALAPVKVASAAPIAPPAPIAALPAKPVQVASLAPVVPAAAPKAPAASDDETDAPKARAYAPTTALAAPAIPAPRPAAFAKSLPEPQPAASDATSHDGWVIQIGATDDVSKAKELLNRALAQNHAMLASARPLTERVQKGEDTFYRARFAMNDSAKADAACRSLKRSGFACIAMHD